MQRFLRSRLAALVLLLASPGFTGLVIDAAHPCPTRAQWMGEHGGGQPAPHLGHHSMAPAGQDSTPSDHSAPRGHDCRCVGACHGSMLVRAGIGDELIARLPLVASRTPHPSQTPFLPRSRPGDRLPPATAPPLA